jgi:hypothetical protein
MKTRSALLLMTAACQGASWQAGFVADVDLREELRTDDGCTLTWSGAALSLTEAWLEAADGAPTAPASAWSGDLLGATEAVGVTTATRAGRFAAAALGFGPPTAQTSSLPDEVLQALIEADAALWLEGELTCDPDPQRAIVLHWPLPGPLAQRCSLPWLEVGGEATLLLSWTLSAAPLFEDDGTTRALPLWRADHDADGELTLAELDEVPAPALGYLPGDHDGEATLGALIASRSRHTLTLPEGTCTAR